MKTRHFLIRLLLVSTVLLQLNATARAQNAPGAYQLKGIISDSLSGKPLPMVTLRLKNSAQQVVGVTLTKEDGSFRFTGLMPVVYQLSVSAVGYGSLVLPIGLSKSAQKILDLGTVYLKSRANSLKEIAVTAERPVIRQKADRIIYELRADPESKANSVLAMMRKVPYLSLDGEDNLLMKGSASFKVLINGKSSGSLQNNLKAVLRSIPASTIERIEVITNPPSRYDAEGLAGIIDIITVHKMNDGINGSLNTTGSFPAGGPGIGGSFTAKKGQLGMSAFGGGSIYESPRTDNTSSRQTLDSCPASLTQQGYQQSGNKTAYLGSEFSFLVDTLNLLTAQFNYNGSHANDQAGQFSLLSQNGVASQQYLSNTENRASGHGLDLGFNYERGFKAMKNRLLTLSYLYSTSINDRNGDAGFADRLNFATPDFQQSDRQKFREHTFQLDFVTPVKKLNIDAGLKAILRNNSSDFAYLPFNNASGQYQADAAQSDSFTNTQNVFSAYNSYRLQLGSWNLNAGVRIEQTVIRADFASTASVADQNYFNVIPNLAVNKSFKDQSSISLGFSQRIRRPGINRLNPYVDRSDPNYELTGNPNLRPVLLNDIQLSYGSNKKLSVNIGLDYSFMNNLDLQVLNFDSGTQITRMTYANTGKSSSAGSNFSLAYPVSKIYSVRLNGNLMYLWLQGPVGGVTVNNNLLMYSLTLSNVLRLGGGWALNADLAPNSRTPTGLQGYTNGYFYSVFNFNKDIVKNRFSLSGGIKNPFTKYRNSISTSFGPDFNQVYQSRNYFRSFSLSLNYNFGGLKEQINKNRTSIENNDRSN